ncbi:hypothetical protein ONZ43_g1106 [Nemania bipapillata]|uniref:Uncharacterized protein n=1 Tax=Nemania bipapillata TaxID=110536 RepID=A0ACC2J640_9PEZI|nr:hypothetical protein ONZ43_g1106 [Nemania bipapillata]
MLADEAPDDPDDPDDGNDEDDENDEDGRGRYDGPRQSYNFAPGYQGVVYRADVPDWGAGPRSKRNEQSSTNTNYRPSSPSDPNMQKRDREIDEPPTSDSDVRYKLQSMKWGLIPFWTKRNPGYGSMMKTINCRDDSLAQNGGMWGSMKARKRCIVIAQGFYEWLKKDGGREKLPHYVRRKDGRLMCLAGLWDVVQMRKWLDPKRYEWSKELQSLLIPYDGELEVYPVSKDVGKVGNNSPAFIIPIDSKQNKSNIANFFAKSPAKKETNKEGNDTKDSPVKTEQPDIKVTEIRAFGDEDTKEGNEPRVKLEEVGEDQRKESMPTGIKRRAKEDLTNQEPPKKLSSTTSSKGQDMMKRRQLSPLKRNSKPKISATSNNSKSPAKTKPSKSAGTQKITKFFTNSS